MDAQELFNALKRCGHTMGVSAISHDGFLLFDVDGRLMKQRDAEKLLAGKTGEPPIQVVRGDTKSSKPI